MYQTGFDNGLNIFSYLDYYDLKCLRLVDKNFMEFVDCCQLYMHQASYLKIPQIESFIKIHPNTTNGEGVCVSTSLRFLTHCINPQKFCNSNHDYFYSKLSNSQKPPSAKGDYVDAIHFSKTNPCSRYVKNRNTRSLFFVVSIVDENFVWINMNTKASHDKIIIVHHNSLTGKTCEWVVPCSHRPTLGGLDKFSKGAVLVFLHKKCFNTLVDLAELNYRAISSFKLYETCRGDIPNRDALYYDMSSEDMPNDDDLNEFLPNYHNPNGVIPGDEHINGFGGNNGIPNNEHVNNDLSGTELHQQDNIPAFKLNNSYSRLYGSYESHENFGSTHSRLSNIDISPAFQMLHWFL